MDAPQGLGSGQSRRSNWAMLHEHMRQLLRVVPLLLVL
jgi:hypothetical protein